MKTTRTEIQARLEEIFSKKGFVEPGVAELQKAAGVSLRTLYRYFPSKMDMVVGALEYRHTRYLDFLAIDEPEPGSASILHLLKRLRKWMETFSPNGCLSVRALSAYPHTPEVINTVERHKQETILIMGKRSGRPDLAMELFLLHEGVSASWALAGEKSVEAAELVVLKLLRGVNHDT